MCGEEKKGVAWGREEGTRQERAGEGCLLGTPEKRMSFPQSLQVFLFILPLDTSPQATSHKLPRTHHLPAK